MISLTWAFYVYLRGPMGYGQVEKVVYTLGVSCQGKVNTIERSGFIARLVFKLKLILM